MRPAIVAITVVVTLGVIVATARLTETVPARVEATFINPLEACGWRLCGEVRCLKRVLGIVRAFAELTASFFRAGIAYLIRSIGIFASL